MNAEKIRELNETMQKKMLEADSLAAWEGGVKSLQCSLLAEIAAQLAEANKALQIILNPPILWDKTELPNSAEWETFPHGVLQLVEPRATLRDQFAMAAMAGNWLELVDGEQANGDPRGTMTGVDFAKWAYNVADAMMEARK